MEIVSENYKNELLQQIDTAQEEALNIFEVSTNIINNIMRSENILNLLYKKDDTSKLYLDDINASLAEYQSLLANLQKDANQVNCDIDYIERNIKGIAKREETRRILYWIPFVNIGAALHGALSGDYEMFNRQLNKREQLIRELNNCVNELNSINQKVRDGEIICLQIKKNIAYMEVVSEDLRNRLIDNKKKYIEISNKLTEYQNLFQKAFYELDNFKIPKFSDAAIKIEKKAPRPFFFLHKYVDDLSQSYINNSIQFIDNEGQKCEIQITENQILLKSKNGTNLNNPIDEFIYKSDDDSLWKAKIHDRIFYNTSFPNPERSYSNHIIRYKNWNNQKIQTSFGLNGEPTLFNHRWLGNLDFAHSSDCICFRDWQNTNCRIMIIDDNIYFNNGGDEQECNGFEYLDDHHKAYYSIIVGDLFYHFANGDIHNFKVNNNICYQSWNDGYYTSNVMLDNKAK